MKEPTGEVRVLLFCPKYDTDNPYYCSNVRLNHLTRAVQTSQALYGARLLRLGGGHRTPLPHNCEAELAFPPEKAEELEGLLAALTGESPVDYQILGGGETQ